MTDKAQAPAGIVRVPGVDDVLDTMEAAIDFADGYQKKFFEGEDVAADEAKRRMADLKQLGAAITSRLTDLGVRVIGAFPELKGRGARFVATDKAKRDYQIDLHLDDEQRMAGETFDAMLDGIDSVNLVEKAVRERYQAYQDDERMARLGLVKGKLQ